MTNNETEIDYISTTELKQLGAAQQAAGNLATAKDYAAAYHTVAVLVKELQSIERGLSKHDCAPSRKWCEARLKSVGKALRCTSPPSPVTWHNMKLESKVKA